MTTAAVLVVALAACDSGTAPGAAHSSGAPPGPATTALGGGAGAALAWHSCNGSQGRVMECTSVQVPLDYANPSGRKITLALSRVRATAPANQRQGVLLVNPGGPGGSGLALAGTVADGLSPSVAAQYDIIGFDPRGVGSSTPALHCDSSFFNPVRPDYIPRTSQDELVLEAHAKAYAAACQRLYGGLLPYMTTANAARDLDSIRAALGQQKISYFAYSYGTYLGEVYATLFPQRIRRMALDSIVDPTGVWYQDNIDQDYAFQGRMSAFFAWVARYDSAYHLGTTAGAVQQVWYHVRGALRARPISGPGGPLIGANEFDDTFLQGGYSDSLWPGLAAALSAYYRLGATSAMIGEYQAFGSQDENEFAVYNAVQCADVAWPRDWARWNRDTRIVYRTAPFQAWDNAWFNAACAFWPVRAPAQPTRIGAAGLPGILMLQGTLDAATPYPGAQRAHALLPTARMVVVEGGGNHGQSLSQPPNACVDGYLNRYLATGALPGQPGTVNATCAALPPPEPTG